MRKESAKPQWMWDGCLIKMVRYAVCMFAVASSMHFDGCTSALLGVPVHAYTCQIMHISMALV